MFVAGLAHGLHPDLTAADSLRSLLGSVAPFAFAFSRLPPDWGRTIDPHHRLDPLGHRSRAAQSLEIAGLRPMFFEGGGERLAGLGHPAFLAGVCLAAIYACLIELYRDGRSRWMALLGVNFVILVLTGARAPLAYATAVTGLTLAFVRPRSPSRAGAASCRCCCRPACCRCWLLLARTCRRCGCSTC